MSTAVRRSRLQLSADAATLAAAGVAEVLTAPAAGIGGGVGWRAAFAVLTLALLALRGAYRPLTGRLFLDGVRMIFSAAALAAMVITFLRLVFDAEPDLAEQAIRSWLFACVYMSAGRAVLAIGVDRSNRLFQAGAPTLILGAGKVGHLVAQRLLEYPEFGLRPVGFLDSDPLELGEGAANLPMLGSDDDLLPVVTAYGIEHAVISFSRSSHESELKLSRVLNRAGIAVSVVPRLFEGIPDRFSLDRVAGLPLMTIQPSNPRGWQVSLKYRLDRVLAIIAIAVLSPVLILAAATTLATLGFPIFFRQRRIGLDGREFDMLKLRTMPGRPEDDGEADAEWAAKAVGDPATLRVDSPAKRPVTRSLSRAGALMRRWGLDELPQLFNVAVGQMSLVGPRPERATYVAMFKDRVRRYDDRHQVKAGITGWAQVHGLRGETSLEDRIEWDNYYIENWSPWLDLKILLLTLIAVGRKPPR